MVLNEVPTVVAARNFLLSAAARWRRVGWAGLGRRQAQRDRSVTPAAWSGRTSRRFAQQRTPRQPARRRWRASGANGARRHALCFANAQAQRAPPASLWRAGRARPPPGAGRVLTRPSLRAAPSRPPPSSPSLRSRQPSACSLPALRSGGAGPRQPVEWSDRPAAPSLHVPEKESATVLVRQGQSLGF